MDTMLASNSTIMHTSGWLYITDGHGKPLLSLLCLQSTAFYTVSEEWIFTVLVYIWLYNSLIWVNGIPKPLKSQLFYFTAWLHFVFLCFSEDILIYFYLALRQLNASIQTLKSLFFLLWINKGLHSTAHITKVAMFSINLFTAWLNFVFFSIFFLLGRAVDLPTEYVLEV